MASDQERPNNSLEAQTSLLSIRLGQAAVGRNRDDLPAIWQGFSDILDRAAGMGEFATQRVVALIEVAGQVAGKDPAYSDLVEKLATSLPLAKAKPKARLSS